MCLLQLGDPVNELAQRIARFEVLLREAYGEFILHVVNERVVTPKAPKAVVDRPRSTRIRQEIVQEASLEYAAAAISRPYQRRLTTARRRPPAAPTPDSTEQTSGGRQARMSAGEAATVLSRRGAGAWGPYRPGASAPRWCRGAAACVSDIRVRLVLSYRKLAGDENGLVASTTNITSACRSVVPPLDTCIGVSLPLPGWDWPVLI